ncbi:MAG: flavin reductase family protein [Desulfobaccales bacterium]|jgi:flavin reductase (DIM6/NTAB) family NADH-FMN oxidoreductase RutF
MAKVNLGANAYIYTMPVTLVGASVEGRANFMTVGWVMRVNLKPPLLAVALNKAHFTPEGIRQNRAFSVNFPGADLMEKTDYCGLVSGRQVDKSGLFRVFYGELETTPLIEECPLGLECRLYEVVELPTNDLFIGEIVAAYVDEDCLTIGQPDILKINPLVLTMPDNHYWTVGELAGEAWHAGKKMKQAGGR